MQNRTLSLVKYSWPAFLVLAADIISLVWLNSAEEFLPTRFSTIVSFLVLFAGWLPLLLQSSPQARQATLFATLLASVIILPPPTRNLNQAILIPLEDFSFSQLWRIFHAMAMLPCALHLVAIIAKNQFLLKPVILIPLYNSPVAWMAAVYFIQNEQALWWLRQLILVWMLICMVVLLLFLAYSVRKANVENPHAAQQMRALLFVGFIVVIPVFLRFVGLFFGTEIIPYEWFLGSLVFLPLGVGYGILRHNLFDIDTLVRRAAGYTITSILASLMIFYIAAATGNRAGTRISQYRWGSIFIALLFLAIIFTPLQRWLQKRIDRWFYPERYSFQENIQTVQNHITRVIRAEEIERYLQEELPVCIGAKWAIWVPGVIPQTPQIAVENPAWSTLLRLEDEILGGFWLGNRISGLPYSQEEGQQLDLLCHQAALALAYAHTLETLEAINLDLEKRVAERTAQSLEQSQALTILTERRRIARDLHDSISQTLFSINLGASAIRKLAQYNPEMAMDELAVLEKSAQIAQKEMRSLLNELREPPEPENIGTVELVSLLKDHFSILATQAGSDGLPPLLNVQYEGQEKLWVISPLADTLLQVCREALHNVIKHAGVHQAICRLNLTPTGIIMIIEDEGKGFNTKQIQSGTMGIENMRQRLSLHTGTLQVNNRSGRGTQVKIEIPWEENNDSTANM